MNLRNLSCISRIFRPHRHTSEIDGSNTKALCGDLFIEPFRRIGAGLTVLCGFPECQYWTNTVCNCFKNKYTQWSATNTTVATLSNLQIHPKLQWKCLFTPNDCIVPKMLVFWGKANGTSLGLLPQMQLQVHILRKVLFRKAKLVVVGPWQRRLVGYPPRNSGKQFRSGFPILKMKYMVRIASWVGGVDTRNTHLAVKGKLP